MSEVHALNLEPGEVVGGYTLISRLGAGAMGSVWRVEDGGGTNYAMKILRDSLDDDTMDEHALTTARERLRREGKALQRIKNPGVCAIVDMEIDDAVAFIVTELIEGNNLREDVMRNGKYMGDDLERLASKLIDAVSAVHAAGIVHRDIKPTNVMISVTGPVLVDFGIAMGEGESHVTSTGLVMGTPGFIAPEVIEGTEANEATDWWSVASVLAFAATGAPVFGTQPMMAVLQREATGNANLQGLPTRTMNAFRKALDPYPERRGSIQELLEAIQADAWSGQESMLPFEQTAPATTMATGATWHRNEDVNNPRHLWQAQSLPTDVITYDPNDMHPNEHETQTQTVTPPPPPATARIAASSPHLGNNIPALPDLPSLQATTTMPSEATTVQPRVAQSLQRNPLAGNTPTTAIAAAAPASEPPFPDPYDESHDDEDDYQEDNGNPYDEAPQPLAPVADTHPARIGRGRLAIALATIPLCIVAAVMPAIAAIAAGILVWLTATLGFDVHAQTARELRRNKIRRRSDTALRVVAMPWHLARAFVTIVPRVLAMWLINIGVTAAIIALTSSPTIDITVPIAQWNPVIPLPYGMPQSSSGLALALGSVISWIALMFGPRSHIMQLGAGTIIGLTQSQQRMLSPQSARPNRRQWIVLALSVICAVGVGIIGETTPIINWFPLYLA